jgi:hypothetical protein
MSPERSVTYVSGTDIRIMVARDGVEPPTPALSGTTGLTPWFINNLTDQSGRFIVTIL